MEGPDAETVLTPDLIQSILKGMVTVCNSLRNLTNVGCAPPSQNEHCAYGS